MEIEIINGLLALLKEARFDNVTVQGSRNVSGIITSAERYLEERAAAVQVSEVLEEGDND